MRTGPDIILLQVQSALMTVLCLQYKTWHRFWTRYGHVCNSTDGVLNWVAVSNYEII